MGDGDKEGAERKERKGGEGRGEVTERGSSRKKEGLRARNKEEENE